MHFLAVSLSCFGNCHLCKGPDAIRCNANFYLWALREIPTKEDITNLKKKKKKKKKEILPGVSKYDLYYQNISYQNISSQVLHLKDIFAFISLCNHYEEL